MVKKLSIVRSQQLPHDLLEKCQSYQTSTHSFRVSPTTELNTPVFESSLVPNFTPTKTDQLMMDKLQPLRMTSLQSTTVSVTLECPRYSHQRVKLAHSLPIFQRQLGEKITG
jgi:hypothetical protein